jgi:dethiobiotin synthetase
MDRCDDVFALLQARLPVPCWGRLPFSTSPDPQALAIHLQLGGNR